MSRPPLGGPGTVRLTTFAKATAGQEAGRYCSTTAVPLTVTISMLPLLPTVS